MTDFAAMLGTLVRHDVAFIVIGGAAAIAHGSVRLTSDLDVVYQRTPANLDRLVAALVEHQPYLRGAPPGLPFHWDKATLLRGLNLTLLSLAQLIRAKRAAGRPRDLDVLAELEAIQEEGESYT